MDRGDRNSSIASFTENGALRIRTGIDQAKISSEPSGWGGRTHPRLPRTTPALRVQVSAVWGCFWSKSSRLSRLGSPPLGRIQSVAILAAQGALALPRLACTAVLVGGRLSQSIDTRVLGRGRVEHSALCGC